MYAPHWFAHIVEMLELRGSANEVLAAIFLSSTIEAVGALTMEGEAQRVHMPIREIVDGAARARAKLVLLVHTHPSGDPRPSSQDIVLTRRLHACLQPHSMGLFDHIILARDRYFSFRSSGLLKASENCVVALATQAPAPYRLPPALRGSYDSSPVGE